MLEIISKQSEISFSELISSLQDSWFWFQASDDEKTAFIKGVRTELWNLDNYGQINRYGEMINPTSFGRASSNFMLSPFSIRNLVGNARRIFSGSYDEDMLSKLILSLVGIPYEIRGNDAYIKRVKPPEEFDYIKNVIIQDKILTEPSERIEYCTNYATVLWYRLHSLPTEEILVLCNLDSSADAAFVDEILPNDAFWILNSLASLPEYILQISFSQREMIKKIALAVKYGTLDSNAQLLLSEKFDHIGRNSAIRISNYLKSRSKNMFNLSESELIELFPSYHEAVHLLYKELQEKNFVLNLSEES